MVICAEGAGAAGAATGPAEHEVVVVGATGVEGATGKATGKATEGEGVVTGFALGRGVAALRCCSW